MTVQLATTSVDLDADGYTLRLGTRSAPVSANGTAIFEDVAAGSYELRLDGVASNCFVEGAGVATISVSASAGAQASFAVGCGLNFGDGMATVACEGLAPATSSGAPLDRIAVGRLPSTLEAPLVTRVQAADGSVEGYTWLDVDAGGATTLVTPPHPLEPLSGGDVWVRVSDGTVACPPWEWTIEPLAAAPGEIRSTVDALQEVVRRQAAVLGATPADLVTTIPDQLAEPLIPLAIVQWVLDHPDNAYSLRAIANGTTPTPFALETIEALLARSGLRAALETRLSVPLARRSLSSSAATPVSAPGASPAGPLAATPASTPAATPGPPLATLSAAECTPTAVGRDTQRLSDCVDAWANVVGVLRGFTPPPELALAIHAERTTPAAQGAVQNVLATIGWAAIQAEVEAAAGLPSQISLEVEATPSRFLEDQSGPGTWSGTVSATNVGWNGALFLFGNFVHSAFRAQGDPLVDAGLNVPPVDDATLSAVFLGAFPTYLPTQNIPQRTFGPVPVDDQQWSESRLIPGGSGAAFKKTGHTTFDPIAVGADQLEVKAPTMGFGGMERTKQIDLQVDSIIVRVEPSDTLMKPGDQAIFRVTFLNAASPKPSSAAARRGTVFSWRESGPSTIEFGYRAPTAANFALPDVLDVTHDAVTGARAGGPRRVGFAFIRLGDVAISPVPACIDTDEVVTFSAVVQGVDDQTVRWTADDGSIGPDDGVYTAPPTRPADGTVTIRAASTTFPELYSEVEIAIGCTCNFTLRVGNQHFGSQSGDQMVFTSFDDRLTGLTLTRPAESWELRMLPGSLDPNARPKAAGQWVMAVQGDFGLTDPADFLYATETDHLAVADLEAYVPRQELRGRVAGTAELVSTVSPGPITFDWWFSIRYAPGEFTCTVQ